jgi:hypothetical protein
VAGIVGDARAERARPEQKERAQQGS